MVVVRGSSLASSVDRWHPFQLAAGREMSSPHYVSLVLMSPEGDPLRLGGLERVSRVHS